jgi:CubicO group peptidase (beta-lactamase class C family)
MSRSRHVRGRSAIAIALLITSVVGCAPGTPAPSPGASRPTIDPGKLSAFVGTVMERYRVPGMAVAVVQNDRVVVLAGYGKRRFDAAEAVDEHTLFALASVTKAFTSALVATCVDDGLLAWDRPCIDDLPELVFKDLYATRMATPRDLLAHRTGLPAFTGDLFDRLGYDRAEVLRRIRLVEPACSFREHANYSNLGFFAAGMLAARVAGDDWETLMQRRIFEPLGMKDATFTYRLDPANPNVAAGHFVSGTSFDAMAWVPQETLAPAGGMAASIADMVPFLRMHLAEGVLDGRRVLSAEAVREMHRPAMVETPDFTSAPPIDEQSGLAFALGWDSYHFAGHEVIEKGGALGGSRSVVSMIPELGIGVAVLANLNLTLAPEAVRAHVLALATGRDDAALQDELWKRQDGLDAMFRGSAEAAAESEGPPSRPLEAYVGTYTSELYGALTIARENDGLRWTLGTAGYSGRLAHVGFDTFRMEFPPGTVSLPEPVTFVLGDDGTPAAAESELLGRMPRERSPARKP